MPNCEKYNVRHSLAWREITDILPIFARSDSAVRPSEKEFN